MEPESPRPVAGGSLSPFESPSQRSDERGLKAVSLAMQDIQHLELLDIETIIKDTAIHETISVASSRVLGFLDSVEREPHPREDLYERLTIFGQLFDVSFLTVLFAHRKVFHRIAAQSLQSGAEASGAIVCWVDAILSKLGDATIAVASGVSSDTTTPTFPASAEYRAEEGLRAASQLPSDWHLVAGVIASEQSSPAAKRLALRLSFSAFVLGPCVRPGSEPKTPYGMMEVLDRCVNQTRASGFSASRAGDRLATQERLNFAMIVSLFATTNREHRRSLEGSQSRPHTLGCLLNILQNVLHPDDPVSSLEFTAPPEDLDPAQTVLLRWGDTVSWCWETWDDHRVANAETIVFLTSIWLRHVDGDDAHPMGVSTASSIAILRVLHQVGLSLSTSAGVLSVSMAMISAACSNAGRSISHLLSHQNEDERWIVSGLCKYLLSLFVLLGIESEEISGINDYIIEALSLLDADTLNICLMHVRQEVTLRFAARLHERFVGVQGLLQQGLLQQTQISNLNLVRSTLNFAAIIWFSRTRGCLLRESVSPLLSSVVGLLLQEGSAWRFLGEALLTTASAARRDPSLTDENRESIWQIAITSVPSELGIVSAFAHYIITSEYLCNSLYCAEAWRYLGEVLLLVLKRHYIEEQEPLALLVCPTLCGAMIRLLQADTASTQFMLSTPFTLNLCADLKSVCEGTHGEDLEYFAFMKARLNAIGTRLLDQIQVKSRRVPSSEVAPEEFPARLMFYRIYGVAQLVLVPDQ
ncbi:hypothetical protein C8F04DRAFT_1075957 [Mycena alexandri]|uniref:Uncharacterized protein n=1 Tax=Mycena alexandri TaxID=1745969 RepID=A0AAD6TDQ5_9AGAR|nr:hypothetical protein C8F04DRAFT_1075957 [Mycena alexandri]